LGKYTYLGNVERPPIQRNISITTPQPIIEIALTCAYYQQVEHEFKNCPFVDDKLETLMKKELKTSLPSTTTSITIIHASVPISQIRSHSGLVSHPTLVNQNLGW